jgi:hypothetical protein
MLNDVIFLIYQIHELKPYPSGACMNISQIYFMCH